MMADNSANVIEIARLLAFTHIIVGLMLFCFGVTDRIVEKFWTGNVGFGIWIGIWMFITGALGIPGTRRERTNSRDAFAGVFMGFSTTSGVFGGAIIICYSISIAENRRETYYGTSSNNNDRGQYNEYKGEMVIAAMILILGIVELVIGAWAAICCCLMKPCTCCVGTPLRQMTSAGYLMVHGPADCVSLTVPEQAGDGRATIQASTSGVQGGQLPVILVPTSGQIGTHMAVPVQTDYGVAPIQTSASGTHGGLPQMILAPTSEVPRGPHLMAVPIVVPIAVPVNVDGSVGAIQTLTAAGAQMIRVPTSGVLGGSPQPGGVLMALPIQEGGDVAAIQTWSSGTQACQPQMILAPACGAQPQPGGVSMVIPEQADGAVFAVQEPISVLLQGAQPSMILASTSGVVAIQPQMYQADTSAGNVTGYPPQEVALTH